MGPRSLAYDAPFLIPAMSLKPESGWRSPALCYVTLCDRRVMRAESYVKADRSLCSILSVSSWKLTLLLTGERCTLTVDTALVQDVPVTCFWATQSLSAAWVLGFVFAVWYLLLSVCLCACLRVLTWLQVDIRVRRGHKASFYPPCSLGNKRLTFDHWLDTREGWSVFGFVIKIDPSCSSYPWEPLLLLTLLAGFWNTPADRLDQTDPRSPVCGTVRREIVRLTFSACPSVFFFSVSCLFLVKFASPCCPGSLCAPATLSCSLVLFLAWICLNTVPGDGCEDD